MKAKLIAFCHSLRKPPVAIGIFVLACILIPVLRSSEAPPTWRQQVNRKFSDIAVSAWQKAGRTAAGDNSRRMQEAHGHLAGALAELDRIRTTCGRDSHEVLASMRRLEELCGNLVNCGLNQEDVETLVHLINEPAAAARSGPKAPLTPDEIERLVEARRHR